MTSPILLYEHPLSPYAQKIRILLREKGLPFEFRTPEAIGTGGANPTLAQLNPRFEVPALQHAGVTLFDSTIILEYLEETFPEPAMMPKAPADRARMRTIEEVCDTHWEAINWGLGEIRFFGRGGTELGPTLRAAAEAQVGHMHAWLARLLGAGPWLTGERFGWGDLAALPYVTMSSMFGIEPPADCQPLVGFVQVRTDYFFIQEPSDQLRDRFERIPRGLLRWIQRRVRTPESDAQIGICLDCVHLQPAIPSRPGRMIRCGLSTTDPKIPEYPTTPIITCDGFRRPAVDGGPAQDAASEQTT